MKKKLKLIFGEKTLIQKEEKNSKTTIRHSRTQILTKLNF